MYSNNISKSSSRKGREGLRESIPACRVLSNLLCVSQHCLGDPPHNTQYISLYILKKFFKKYPLADFPIARKVSPKMEEGFRLLGKFPPKWRKDSDCSESFPQNGGRIPTARKVS
ncbi:MAG: hypothetical protein LBR17_06110, partial [Bacteroidales bacterium]|nr:hypothetical protein [Bacteroidales bacterium]